MEAYRNMFPGFQDYMEPTIDNVNLIIDTVEEIEPQDLHVIQVAYVYFQTQIQDRIAQINRVHRNQRTNEQRATLQRLGQLLDRIAILLPRVEGEIAVRLALNDEAARADDLQREAEALNQERQEGEDNEDGDLERQEQEPEPREPQAQNVPAANPAGAPAAPPPQQVPVVQNQQIPNEDDAVPEVIGGIDLDAAFARLGNAERNPEGIEDIVNNVAAGFANEADEERHRRNMAAIQGGANRVPGEENIMLIPQRVPAPAERVVFAPLPPAGAEAEVPVWLRGLRLMGVAQPAGEAVPMFQADPIGRVDDRLHAWMFGAANNTNALSAYIHMDPLFRTIRLMGTRLYPFNDTYDSPFVPIVAFVWAHLRIRAVGQNSSTYRLAVAVGEACAPSVPRVMIEDEVISRAAVRAGVMAGVMAEGAVEDIATVTAAQYTAFMNLPVMAQLFPGLEFPAVYPFTQATVQAFNAQGAMAFIYFLSQHTIRTMRSIAIEMYASAYTALARRGELTEDFALRITTALRQELQVAIRLDRNAAGMIYNQFMQGVDETNAGVVFATLVQMIPAIALRLRLTLEHAAFSGLTQFALIGRALRMFPNFYWAEVDVLIPGQLQKWVAARFLVAGNAYYGFKKDLGTVASTNYRGIAYVAWRLLTEVGGEGSLRQYQGCGRNSNVPNRVIVDRYIQMYIDELSLTDAQLQERGVAMPQLRREMTRQTCHRNMERYWDLALTCTEQIFDS